MPRRSKDKKAAQGTRMSVTIPPKDLGLLKQISERKERSVAWVAREAVEKYLSWNIGEIGELPPVSIETLELIAERKNSSVARVIREAIEQYIKAAETKGEQEVEGSE